MTTGTWGWLILAFPLAGSIIIALGWRGIPLVLRDHAAQWLRRYPRFAAMVSRVLHKRNPGEEE